MYPVLGDIWFFDKQFNQIVSLLKLIVVRKLAQIASCKLLIKHIINETKKAYFF